MKLKDYIKYYIGCRVEAYPYGGQQKRTECGRLVGIGIYDIVSIKFDTWQSVADVSISCTKPILRRLEDMTEEEAKYILDNYSFCSVDMPMNEKKFAIEIAKRLINQMPVAHYLLQQKFDLFGLIDAGLAIDIKTLTP